jgi:uncharacterized FlgJ-related protein
MEYEKIREKLTFAELEKSENVTAGELIETLKEYAQEGSRISSMVVISIIKKTELSEADYDELIKISQRGINVQGENRKSSQITLVDKMQNEYKKVIDYIGHRDHK